MSLDTVTMLDANDQQVTFGVVTLSGGQKLAAHVFVDGLGNITGASANPLLTAPAIKSADFIPYSGTVAIAGAVLVDVPVNTARTGGYVTAGRINQGVITVTLIKADGVTTHVETLGPGASFPFAVSPGSVLQQSFTVSGDTLGDTFTAVEFE